MKTTTGRTKAHRAAGRSFPRREERYRCSRAPRIVAVLVVSTARVFLRAELRIVRYVRRTYCPWTFFDII
jgi:hypothetical protein